MIPAYVINMASQPGRWRRAAAQLDSLGLSYQRFPAVNGAALTNADLERHVDWDATRRWKFGITRPEIGCFLSHLSLIQMIAQDRNEGAVILEDDFVASDGLPDVMEALSRLKFSRPVIVRLDSPPKQLAIPVYQRTLTNALKLVVPLRIPPHSTAYYLNRAAAQILAKECRNFYMPIDCQFRHHWQTGVDVLMVSPAPVRMADTGYRDTLLEPFRKYRRRWTTRVRHFRRIARREGCGIFHLPGRVLRATGDPLA